MSRCGNISTFILGGLVGAALGVLFAPRPGYETREMIVDRALDYYDNVDSFYDNASDRAVELYSTSRDVAIDATEQVRAKIEVARARLMAEVEAVSGKAEAEDDVAEQVAEVVAEEVVEAPVEAEVVAEEPEAPAKASVKKVSAKKASAGIGVASAKAKA